MGCPPISPRSGPDAPSHGSDCTVPEAFVEPAGPAQLQPAEGLEIPSPPLSGVVDHPKRIFHFSDMDAYVVPLRAPDDRGPSCPIWQPVVAGVLAAVGFGALGFFLGRRSFPYDNYDNGLPPRSQPAYMHTEFKQAVLVESLKAKMREGAPSPPSSILATDTAYLDASIDAHLYSKAFWSIDVGLGMYFDSLREVRGSLNSFGNLYFIMERVNPAAARAAMAAIEAGGFWGPRAIFEMVAQGSGDRGPTAEEPRHESAWSREYVRHVFHDPIDVVRYQAVLTAVHPILGRYFRVMNGMGPPMKSLVHLHFRMRSLNAAAARSAIRSIVDKRSFGIHAAMELVMHGSGLASTEVNDRYRAQPGSDLLLEADAFSVLLTEPVDAARMERELRRLDPVLADYFDQGKSVVGSMTTFSDVALYLSLTNPEALKEAQRAIKDGSFSGPRAILEMIVRGSGWTPAAHETTLHAERVVHFEEAMRQQHAGEGRGEARSPGEREERERSEREGRQGPRPR